ncbi:MAG: glycosyl hydrolase, partial [Bacteroidales bacterium]|nr:glycosyl hydrolase [Bacteroidales bacterium]
MRALKSILITCLVCYSCSVQESNSSILFVSFKDPGNTGIWFALSDDALNYQAINKGKPVIPSNDSIRIMRDPFIARDVEHGYHMVWTTGKQKIGYAWSPDLIDWSKQRKIPVDNENDSVINTWAPELIYDENEGEWLIIYSSTILGEFPGTKGQVRNDKNHRIYAVSTKDFITVSEPRLFFDPGYPVIDATIMKENDSYFMVFKD